ncbi:MAG: MFS transporter [bacterium]|nr:MFS transporter [bacterium]
MRSLIRMFGPASGYRRDDWRLLGLMYMAGLFQGYVQTQAVNTLPFVRLAFDLSKADMSYLFAIARVGSLVAVVYAVFGDRWGRRGPFLMAYLMLMVATGATAAAFSPTMYTALQVVARMGSAAMAMLATVLLAEQVNWNNRAWAISLYSTAVALGSGAGLLALPIAQTSEAGWRLLFAASVAGLPLYLWLRGRVEESRVFRFDTGGSSVFAPLVGRGAGRFWLAGIYSLSISAFSAVAVTFALERLVNGLGLTSSEAARILLIGGTLGGTGFFLGGRMGDTLGRKPTILLSLVVGLAGGIGFYWTSSKDLLIVAATLSAFGSSAAMPVSAAQRTELFPTAIRATATQWLHTVAVLGSILGLTIAGTTIEMWSLPVTVTVLGVGVLVAMLAQLVIPETLGDEMDHMTTNR